MNEFVGKLILMSAPSGSGKTTLVKHLIATRNDILFSISCTTREKREGEKEGKDYYFLNIKDFRRRIKQGEFVEYEEVYKDVFYGTLESEIKRIWKLGKHVIFDVDVVGGTKLKERYSKRALAIFIKAPSFEVIVSRLRSRATETEEKLQQRLNKVKEELKWENKFDVILPNNDLEIAKNELSMLVDVFLNDKRY